MPFSAGVFSRIYSWATEQLASPIEISKLDTQEEDIATALSNCILRDGTGLPIASISWNGQNLTGAGTISATLFSGSGASLTTLNASNVSSGTLADARLSSNVPLKDAANTFTASQTINPGNLILSDGTSTMFITNNGGTGYFGTSSNHPWNFRSNDTDRGAISAAGNWTINAPESGVAMTTNGVSGASATWADFTDGSRYFRIRGGGSGAVYIGAATSHNLQVGTNDNVNLTLTNGGGMQLGSPTGGDKGAGTLNTAGVIYQNNVQVALRPLISVGAALNISSIAVGQSAIIYKNTGTTRTSLDAPTADDILIFTNAPSGTYITEGVLVVEQESNVADFKLGWPRATAEEVGILTITGEDDAATLSTQGAFFSITAQTLSVPSGGPSKLVISVTGIEASSGAQTLGPQWSQGTSEANDTTLHAQSWLKVTRVS